MKMTLISPLDFICPTFDLDTKWEKPSYLVHNLEGDAEATDLTDH